LSDPFRIVLVSPRNPLNIGAVARAMSNFGFTDLRLVNPYDVAFREARSAVRAHYVLEKAQLFTSVHDAVRDATLVVGSTGLGHRDLHVPLYGLEAASDPIRSHAQSAPVAILFGSEKFGLSNDDISHCHWLFRIPTRPEHESMNLGQAVAVTLYELKRSQEAAGVRFDAPELASGEQAQRFNNLLAEALQLSGWVNETTSSSTILKIRRLVLRLGLRQSDAETWAGILRQIVWKLKQ
jgi:TrmH family RNA methyltransferase